jgi:hypothetical protein
MGAYILRPDRLREEIFADSVLERDMAVDAQFFWGAGHAPPITYGETDVRTTDIAQ